MTAGGCAPFDSYRISGRLCSINIVIMSIVHIRIIFSDSIRHGASVVAPSPPSPLDIVLRYPVMAGLVRSPISATLPQVMSRLFLVWGVLYPVPEVCKELKVADAVAEEHRL